MNLSLIAKRVQPVHTQLLPILYKI